MLAFEGCGTCERFIRSESGPCAVRRSDPANPPRTQAGSARVGARNLTFRPEEVVSLSTQKMDLARRSTPWHFWYSPGGSA